MDNNILLYHKLASDNILRAMDLYLESIQTLSALDGVNYEIQQINKNINPYSTDNPIEQSLQRMKLNYKLSEKQKIEDMLNIKFQRIKEHVISSLKYSIELIKLCVQPNNQYSARLAEQAISSISSFIERRELKGKFNLSNVIFDLTMVKFTIPMDFYYFGLKTEIDKLEKLL